MKRSRIAIALLMLFVAQVSSSIAATAEVVAGATVLSGQSADGAQIEVRITTSTPHPCFLYRKKYLWGGGEAEPPTLLIESIDVTSAGERIYVPLSAFADLGNPKKASIEVSGDGFQVLIIGGDAGGAYDARLTFEGSWLIQRRVASREFPDEAWEVTRYAFNRN
jgi:hypothetical protein